MSCSVVEQLLRSLVEQRVQEPIALRIGRPALDDELDLTRGGASRRAHVDRKRGISLGRGASRRVTTLRPRPAPPATIANLLITPPSTLLDLDVQPARQVPCRPGTRRSLAEAVVLAGPCTSEYAPASGERFRSMYGVRTTPALSSAAVISGLAMNQSPDPAGAQVFRAQQRDAEIDADHIRVDPAIRRMKRIREAVPAVDAVAESSGACRAAREQ